MSSIRLSRRQFVGTTAATALSGGSLRVLPECAAEPAPTRPAKKLIGWGSDVAYPAKVQTNIRKIEELPLDGLVLSNFVGKKNGREFTFDWECFGTERFERDHLTDTIEILANTRFKRFTDNFLRFNVQPGNFDWFDDFRAPLHNIRMWSAVAKDVGAKGLKFDVEDYKEKLFVYRKQKQIDTKSFEEYADQIRLRGRQVMEALQAGFPDMVVLLSLAHSYVYRSRPAGRPLADLSSYGLLPAFVDGLVEAAGPTVRLIDGQEQAYGYLTAEEYFRGYHDIRQGALELVPRRLWTKYRQTMEPGVALFANYQLGVPRSDAQGRHWPATYMTPEQRQQLFEQNVFYALKTTDEYAWLYSELMGWWESGHQLPTPPGSVDAIRSARAKIADNSPIDIDLRDAVENARERMREATRQPN